jgi:hypothetical protein
MTDDKWPTQPWDDSGEDDAEWLEAAAPLIAARVLRAMAARVRADFEQAGMRCGWVGALDDEADEIEGDRDD